jgi:hypothetical protein
MAKSSNKEPLTPLSLSPQEHSKMKEHSHLQRVGWKFSPPPIYWPSGKDRSTSTLGVTTQALKGAFWSTHEVLHRTTAHPSGLHVLPTQAPRSCRMSPASKLLGAPESRLRPLSLRYWFCGSIPRMTWLPRRPDSVLVLWSKPTKPRVQTPVVRRYPQRLHLGFEAEPRNCTWLHLAFLATMRPALDPVRPLGPSSWSYSSFHSSEATQAKTFRARSSPAPTQIKLRPAPAILGQESVHTMLSITHHTKERPSTGLRTLRSSVSPLMIALTAHT